MDEPPKRAPRRHGLHCPLHPRQIVVLILLWSSVFVFFALIAPFTPQSQRLVFHVVHGVLMFLLFSAWLKVSLSDPSASARKVSPVESTAPGTPLTSLCPDCKIFMGPGMKHCKLCVKCVSGFDHHCLYLNTCIARDNYKSFFCTLCLVIALVILQLIAAFSIVGAEEGNFTWARAVSVFGSFRPWQILLGIGMIFPFVVGLPTLALTVFHVYLVLTGATTYSFLIARREAAADKERKRVEASPEFAAARKKKEIEQEQIRKQFMENKEKEKKLRELQMARVETQP